MISSRLLYVGDLSNNSRSFQRYLALKRIFNRVDCIYNFDRAPRLINRLNYFSIKIGFPIDSLSLNKRLVLACKSNRYEYLWVEKNLSIQPRTYHYIKRLNPRIKIYSYSEDDMFKKSNRSYLYTNSLKYFDFVVTTKSYNADHSELPSLGAKNVIFLDKAFDPNLCFPGSVLNFPGDIKDQLLIVFVGSYELHRAKSIYYLATKGIKVNIWGDGWNKCKYKHSNMINHNFSLNIENYRHIISNAMLTLCFLRKSARDLQTARTMEIPACGGLMLAERTDEHLRLFKEDLEALYFSSDNPDELYCQVLKVINDKSHYFNVRLNGYHRAISSNYTHYDRLSFIFGKVS